MNILIIGGTRNLGHDLAHLLIDGGHRVTTFNRGRTRDELPEAVERLHGDRTIPDDLVKALGSRSFDAVVDTTLYKQTEAEAITRLLRDRMGQYIFLSSGQVYLVREGAPRPFTEDNYDGLLMPAPVADTFNFTEWEYGMDKRRCEDVLRAAWEREQFPYTTLRLPMVNSERDHFHRLYNYVLRLDDGGAILAPSTPNYPLRHVYGKDIGRAIIHLLTTRGGIGTAINLSQDETYSLEAFLTLLGAVMDVRAEIVRVPRARLEADGFLPDCSPFSERWMSELDNTYSKTAFGITYTPVSTYLKAIVAHYRTTPPPPPRSYRRRKTELSVIVDKID
ncbi:MAG: NAD-dependent epimerase/dehydratase family protein [Chloroflexota bacterium]|nr:NAD-dependent epimerase/dehydratase family protein [Chloroflexota bacterium]